MSKRQGKTYPKPPVTERMASGLVQPLTIKEFTMYYLNAGENNNITLRVMVHMFARLLTVLVGRKVLNAPDFYYIMTGAWIENVQFSDWTPEQEHEEGLQPGVLLDR